MAQDQAAPKEKSGGAFYLFVLISIALGAALGAFDPTLAQNEWIKALGDDFVKLIKMIIAPVIFCTVASGIGNAHGGAKVGRVGLTALVYFEIFSTFALGLGLVVGEIARPGAGFSGIKPNAGAVTQYLDQAHHLSPVDFVSNIIPDTLFGAFAKGDILQVLFCAILFGFALMGLGERGAPLRAFVDEASAAFFGMVKIIMRAAPFGAFGAMAYTVGKFGVAALISLGALVACFYLTAILFVLIVLGAVAALAGFNIFKFLAYIREELLIILGTSSSESALPGLMQKLEKAGCARQVVGLVVPTGYSFNLDGTNIYMTLASVFIAQAMGVNLSMTQELTILGVAMLTSKGASGVTGAGFITLASTLAAVNPALLPGMAIVLGVDKFMSECRALTNVCGNGVATIVISRLEKALDRTMLKQALG